MPVSPQVSVIVTTYHRPRQLCAAVASALDQSLRDIEVIVVLDGPDAATMAAVESLKDDRLRIHVRENRGGQAAAINSGVQLARGPWTALLDDDDEWMPQKLETQLRTAGASAYARPVVGCYFHARVDKRDVRWPSRAPRRGEAVGDYMFCRTRLAFGEGVIPTSMLFAPTSLFRCVPMDEDLPRHCDLDWLIRADALPDVGLEMPVEPVAMAVWHLQGHDRLSRAHDWRFSYDWIGRIRTMVSPRAYAGFLLTWVSFSARSQRDLRAIPTLLNEAFRRGRPGTMELAVYAAVWCLPLQLRARSSDWLARVTDRGGVS
jgi:glycosyltransferase involved in cell wall biosynthesis